MTLHCQCLSSTRMCCIVVNGCHAVTSAFMRTIEKVRELMADRTMRGLHLLACLLCLLSSASHATAALPQGYMQTLRFAGTHSRFQYVEPMHELTKC